MDIDPSWWDTASFEGRPLTELLAERDISALLRFLRTRGFSRARLAALTGLSETRVRQIAQGRQRVTTFDVLERIATGLQIPHERLGLAGNGAAERDGMNVAADPLVQAAWDGMLKVFAERSNTAGCAILRLPTTGQIRLITALRQAAVGRQRVYLLTAEARWTEFLSWIEAHGRGPGQADRLLDRAFGLAVEAQDRHLAAYMLMRMSQQALDVLDGKKAVGLARRAHDLGQLPPRTSALCLVREAEGHALEGDAGACYASIEHALRLAGAPPESLSELAGHCTVQYVRACEARCRQILGDSRVAAQRYEEVLADWPHDARLDEGLWRADLAAAYLDEGEPERAAAEGLSALRVASATSSARTVRAVSTLLPRLRRHRDLAVLPALADTYRVALAACHD